jgi:hypothetical protein
MSLEASLPSARVGYAPLVFRRSVTQSAIFALGADRPLTDMQDLKVVCILPLGLDELEHDVVAMALPSGEAVFRPYVTDVHRVVRR